MSKQKAESGVRELREFFASFAVKKLLTAEIAEHAKGEEDGPESRNREEKPGTGDPLHTQEPVTVASFRTWRGWRECVARDRCLTIRF